MIRAVVCRPLCYAKVQEIRAAVDSGGKVKWGTNTGTSDQMDEATAMKHTGAIILYRIGLLRFIECQWLRMASIFSQSVLVFGRTASRCE